MTVNDTVILGSLQALNFEFYVFELVGLLAVGLDAVCFCTLLYVAGRGGFARTSARPVSRSACDAELQGCGERGKFNQAMLGHAESPSASIAILERRPIICYIISYTIIMLHHIIISYHIQTY